MQRQKMKTSIVDDGSHGLSNPYSSADIAEHLSSMKYDDVTVIFDYAEDEAYSLACTLRSSGIPFVVKVDIFVDIT